MKRHSAELRFGLAVLGVWAVLAVAAPWLAPYDPLQQQIQARLQPPSLAHWLGTDSLGRDVLSRLLYGARPTLLLVTLVAAFMAPIGLTFGIFSGYFSGSVDRFLSGITNVVMAFPQLVLALAFVGLLGPGLINVALALILTGWPAYARLSRAETQLLRRSDYIAAAEMLGIQGPRLLFGHVLPACLPALRARLALDLAGVVLTAAALSFLGLGARPPMPEWGTMVAEGGRVVFDQWWLAAMPGAAIFLLSIAFNSIADGLREGNSRGR
jgi:peptide/nickel transport system permease protein